MNALKPRAPFQVLTMSEESRLGREQIETAYALKQITDSGVRVCFYLEDRERTLATALEKVMPSTARASCRRGPDGGGRLVYGRTCWMDRAGTKVKVDVPEREWLSTDAPALRIVSEEAWAAAHARLERTRQTYGLAARRARPLGERPAAGVCPGRLAAPHLLSGFVICGVCQGAMHAIRRTSKRRPASTTSATAGASTAPVTMPGRSTCPTSTPRWWPHSGRRC